MSRPPGKRGDEPSRPQQAPGGKVPATGMVSVARGLSKLGIASRAEGERMVQAGRVRINGRVVRDIAFRITPETDRIEIDDAPVERVERVYLALNKPRGLVTTRHDPQGRPTIYECLENAPLPFLAPVGRLDKASEGLLLLTNDSRWSARLLEPRSHVEKVYHVQIALSANAHAGHAIDTLVRQVSAGVVERETGESLPVTRASLLRTGSRSSAWLEIGLDEGRNRHIRRIFAELGVEVLRLVRVSIGPLALGELPKGEWRHLTRDELRALAASERSGR